MKSIVLLLALSTPAYASGTANEDWLDAWWESFTKRVSDWDWASWPDWPSPGDCPEPPVDEDPSEPDEEEGEE